MATIEKLPLEIIAGILSYLDGRDLASTSLVCRRFNDAVNIDAVWHDRAVAEFNVRLTNIRPGLTCKDVYTRLLFKYGEILGLWCDKYFQPYGGLLQTLFADDDIRVNELLASCNKKIGDPLQSKTIFSISLDEQKKPRVWCHRGYHKKHSANIQLGSFKGDEYVLDCCEPILHKHPEGEGVEFENWLAEEANDNEDDMPIYYNRELMIMKFLVQTQNRKTSRLTPINHPVPYCPGKPIQPGLFQGTYGGHGLEIVHLHYPEHAMANITKITGDPNISAGKISIKADLQRPMILTEEQQLDFFTLSEIDTADLPPGTAPDNLPPQPFKVPRDFIDRLDNKDMVPSQCRTRYHSEGQIAGHGGSHPKFIKGHWIVFNEDTFGHIWMDLRSFSIFKRIKL